jgi:anti-sigma factor RsiW
MKTRCRVVRSIAPTTDVAGLSRILETHMSSCLSCQAEMARYGRLQRQLALLADVVVAAPAPLVAEVEEAIASSQASADQSADDSHPARIVAAAGAVVAAAAGAVAVAMWRHSRPVV